MDPSYESFLRSIHDYMKKCKTYDRATKSIHTSDLKWLCNHFPIEYHSLIKNVKKDSQDHVPYSEIRYFVLHTVSTVGANRHGSPNVQPPPPIDTYYPLSSHRHPQRDIPYSMYPYDTEGSYTPDHDYTPDDTGFIPQEIKKSNEYNSSWSNPGSPPEPGVVPPPPSRKPWENDGYRRGSMDATYCTNCNYWQGRVQELEKSLVSVNREKDKLQSYNSRLQQNLQQNTDYYQMISKENSRFKQEIKRLKEGSVSDGGGSSSFLEKQNEDLRRTKDDIEAALKQCKQHCAALKQENDDLKYQIDQNQRHIWYLKDEKQKLESSQLQRESKLDHRMPAGYYNVDIDVEPVRDKPSRNKQQEPIDGSVFVVLNKDVSTNVLPESLTIEQRHQIIFGLQNCHSIEELLRCLISYGVGTMTDDRSEEIRVENNRLRCQVKSLEAKNSMLSSSLDNAKLETEEMYQKVSCVEANNCRLRRIVQLSQQACEVHEMLYEMKEAEARPPSTSSTFSPMDFDSPTRTNAQDGTSSKNILTQVRSLLKQMELNQELQLYLPTVHGSGKTSIQGWNLSMSQITGGTGTTSGLSCASSLGPEAELNSTEIEQLKMYYQALVRYSKYLLSSLEKVDGLQGIDSVKNPLITEDSIRTELLNGGKILDMEDAADTEELCKIREEKAELRSQIYMMEQTKRSIDLQLSQKSLSCLMFERQCHELKGMYQIQRKKKQRLKDKIKLMRTENPHMADWNDQSDQLKLAWESEQVTSQRYDGLFNYLQGHIEKSQTVTEELVEFVKELLRANRALVEAFERAKKRQQTEKRQLKSELKNLMLKPPNSVGGQQQL